MKLSYLITAYNNYHHLNRLVCALNDRHSMFYLHIDKKSGMPTCFDNMSNLVFVDRVEVWWGGFSHLEAIVSLMKEAIESKSDYYILLSGVDYPIRSKKDLYLHLESGDEFVNITSGFNDNKPEDRIKYYHFDKYDRRAGFSVRTGFFRSLERILRFSKVSKRKYPFDEIYHGSTWWALSHECVEYICKFIKDNPDKYEFYKTCWCPEETLLQTIIANSRFMGRVRPNLSYVNWDANPAPGLITEEHVDFFKKRDSFRDKNYGEIKPFFARKFCDDSFELVELIDRKLR